jgi:opacity protein-like surface antigen
MAMGHYHLNNSSAYLLGGIGMAFASAEIDYEDPDFPDLDDSDSEVAITLGAGLNATPKMFFEGRFNAISDANSLGLHMGLRF